MSKNDSIDTPEALLATFVSSLEGQQETDPPIRAALLSGGGAELRLEAMNQKFQFSIQPQLYPSRKVFDQGVLDKGRPVILLCPHIPDELAADYRKQSLNHADLNGRLFIKTESYLLDRQPRKRFYRNPVSEPDLFSLKSSRIVRALLSQRGKGWTQEELREHTRLSPGLISRILKTLVAHGHVSRQEAGSETSSRACYHLQEFDRLLDAWKAADDWTKRVTVQQFSVLSSDVKKIASSVTTVVGEAETAFTQWFAAHLRHP